MATIFVSTSVELLAAASAAKAGDVISLASGSYSGIALQNLNFTSMVTITSTDASKPAVLTDLTVRGSSNLTFSNVDFISKANGAITDFQVLRSSNIKFDHVEVSGPPLGPGEKQFGLWLRDSSQVTVTNSEFHQFVNAIFSLNNTGVTITDSSFHDIRSDGVQSAGSSQVTIADNLFTNFRPQAGDHADAIQFHTAGIAVASRDITITGNVIARGSGEAAQGIFVTDQAGVSYRNVNISDNLLVGTMWNAIAVIGATSGSVSDNVVLGYADMKAYLRVENSQVAITRNSATAYVTTADGTGTPKGNALAQVPQDYGVAGLSAWLATRETPGETPVFGAKLLADLQELDSTLLHPLINPVIYVTDGFAGFVGGKGQVIGTNASQHVTILDQANDIVLDSSFSRGNDVVSLSGNAADYTIALAGSCAVLMRGDSAITVPVGTVGLALSFADGIRQLAFDMVSGFVKIGDQVVSASRAQVAAAPDLSPFLSSPFFEALGDELTLPSTDFSAEIPETYLFLTADIHAIGSGGEGFLLG